MCWILHIHCFLVLSIQWIFRNRKLDLLCMHMHRIGSFHFSMTSLHTSDCNGILINASGISKVGVVVILLPNLHIESQIDIYIDNGTAWYFNTVANQYIHRILRVL